MPPAKGFWSPTMYDASFSFVANPLNRYTLSARNELKTNPDGSVDPLIQHESPGKGEESNWLPAPATVCSYGALVLDQRDASIATGRELDVSGGEEGTIKTKSNCLLASGLKVLLPRPGLAPDSA